MPYRSGATNGSRTPKRRLRRWLLTVHLYVGIAAASFLLLLGATGVILAFDSYYDEWIHPSLWLVTEQGAPISEENLTSMVEGQFAPARVQTIDVHESNHAQLFRLNDGATVFVDPFKGSVLGVRRGAPEISRFTADVRRLHSQLALGYTGRRIIDVANVLTVLLIVVGLYLWWEKKRLTVNWKLSWSRFNWDLHSVAGIYAAIFLVGLSVTGFFIGSEESLYRVVGSGPQPIAAKPHSVPLTNSGELAASIGLNRALEVADLALPNLRTARIRRPQNERDTYIIEKHVASWSAAGANSTVYIDQYTGQVLRLENVEGYTRGFHAYRLNLALHTGSMFGLAGRAVLALSSLALVVMVATGLLIWVKKKGWMNTAERSRPGDSRSADIAIESTAETSMSGTRI